MTTPTLAPPPPTGARSAAAAEWQALAPLLAQSPRMRVSRDGGRTFPARYEQALTAQAPGQPATIGVYDPHRGVGRLLVADFDVSKARAAGTGDPVRRVAADTASFAALIARLGGRPIIDVSPGGGRHVYVLLAAAQPWWELRQVALALAVRYPALDAGPMCSARGQIRPPGAPDRSRGGRLTGWRRLDMPLKEALAAARAPGGPRLWEALRTELAAELDIVAPALLPTALPAGGTGPDTAVDDGVPWRPRVGGRRPLRGRLAELARTGDWQAPHLQPPTGPPYASASEARLAVLDAAAAAGWRLAELHDDTTGAWAGLDALLARRRPTNRRPALLRDWHTAVAASRQREQESGRNLNTRGTLSTPPLLDPSPTVFGVPIHRPPPPGRGPLLTEYQAIRQWWQAVWIAERDRAWGRQATSIRLVLRALGAAAQMSGSTTVGWGVRALSLMTGLDYTTAANALKTLRNEPDPLIDRVARARRQRADTYLLCVPDRYAELAAWRRWRAGNIEAIHPAFHPAAGLGLGGTCALTYEALSTAPTRLADLRRIAHLSASATTTALRTLAAHGLAERHPGGWVRGPAALDDVADQLGAADAHTARIDLYRAHRSAWWDRLNIPPAPTHPTNNPADTPPAPAPADVDAELDALGLVMQELGGRVIRGP